MSGLDTLNKRLKYYGGNTEQRMEHDKLRSLKDALYNSYQAETAVLEDSREFKCLINPDKLHTDYDNKMLSIPYEDICLTSHKKEVVDLHPGDTFTWKETNTHWIIFLQYLEERAYFRADIRKCDQKININGQDYWVYIRGPVETSVPWNQKGGIEWNDLNYSLTMFIKQDENTRNFFHRFQKVKIAEPGTNILKTWKVVGKNTYYGDGIIHLYLDEDYENSLEDAMKEEEAQKPINPIDKNKPFIEGSTNVYKYDTVSYQAKNFTEQGQWYLIDNEKEKEMHESAYLITLDIAKSTGSFKLVYKTAQEKAEIVIHRHAI